MKKDDKIVYAVKDCYVADDCVQIMIPVRDNSTILSQDGILFHSEKKNSSVYTNKYLEDERRHQFPYSNIPMHYERKGLFGKLCYVNQVFDFGKPYILMNNCGIGEYVAFKDNNRALLVSPTSISLANETSNIMSSDELIDYISKKNQTDNDNQTSYNIIKGKIISTDSIIDAIKVGFQNKTIDFVSPFLSVQFINDDLRIQMIRILLGGDTFGRDFGKVVTYDVPITKYTLEQLKYSEVINNTKEPKIPLKLNPGVSKEDLDLAIQKIKKII